ncbi:acyltransferase family protein [Aeromonas veronii]
MRISWIDNLKFLGMFYIYIGHFAQSAGLLYPYVFSFHVPLFFFISGIFFSHCRHVGEMLFVWKKAFTKIIIPYVMFSIVALVIYSIKFQWDFHTTIETGKLAIYGLRNQHYAGSLWFLPCLFIVIIYHSILVYMLRSLWLVLFVSAIIYSYSIIYGLNYQLAWFFNADSAMFYLIYFSTGAFLSNFLRNLTIDEMSCRSKITALIVLLFSLCISALMYFKGSVYTYNVIDLKYADIVIEYVVTLVLFIPSIFAAMYITSSHIAKLGQSSLVLCGTEQLLKEFLSYGFIGLGLTINLSNPLSTILYTCLCFFVAYHTTVKAYNYIMYGRRLEMVK